MYSVTLYCSNDDCLALFEAEGSQEAIEGAHCPFCCCCLGELSWTPVETAAVAGLEGPPQELELWTLQEPLGHLDPSIAPLAAARRARRRGKGRRPRARRLKAA